MFESMEKVIVPKTAVQRTRVIAARRLAAHRALMEWRKKNAERFKGLDTVKIIRAMRDGKIR